MSRGISFSKGGGQSHSSDCPGGLLLIVSVGAKSHSIYCPGGGGGGLPAKIMSRGSQLPNCSSTGGVRLLKWNSPIKIIYLPLCTL